VTLSLFNILTHVTNHALALNCGVFFTANEDFPAHLQKEGKMGGYILQFTVISRFDVYDP